MSAIKLAAEVREGKGKGAARRLRRQGKLPGVIYAGGKEATAVAVVPKEFVKAMKGPLRRNQLLELDLPGGGRKVMVRDLQIDPIRREPKHVDFLEVDESKPVIVRVPFKTTGRSKAVVAGAKLALVLRDLKVRVLPTAIPEKIEVDVTELGTGPFRAKEVNTPEGCELLEDGHLTVLTISRPRGTVAAEGEGGEAGAGAAPAAS
jgi:large subunit ribosomal protein L25